jgi:hypothetical protein
VKAEAQQPAVIAEFNSFNGSLLSPNKIPKGNSGNRHKRRKLADKVPQTYRLKVNRKLMFGKFSLPRLKTIFNKRKT